MESKSANRPHLLILIGIPGSGKSYFAKHFATSFNAPLISFDEIKKVLVGNILLNAKQISVINKVMDYIFDESLKTRHTVIIDGMFATRSSRLSLERKARSFGYEPVFIWVQTDKTAAKSRLKKLYKDKAADAEKGIDRFAQPLKNESVVVISGQHTFSSQLKIVLSYLSKPETKSIENVIRRPLIGSR